ncbi:MAG: hypothetical protein JKY19_09845, partial [Alcanivoracaceae bacterium]|nr:hypothetical protein [Alcanivoracaceae bacterium]
MVSQKIDLNKMLKAVINTGAKLSLGSEVYAAAFKIADNPNAELATATVTFQTPLIVTSLSNVAGLFSGQSISSLIPSGSIPIKDIDMIAIESVGFVLATKIGEIVQLRVKLGFNPKGKPPGYQWTIFKVDDDKIDFNLSLDSINVVWTSSPNSSGIFMATVNGEVVVKNPKHPKTGTLSLDASMTFPGLTVNVGQVAGTTIDLGTFFTSLGLSEMKIADNITLKNFDFSAVPVNKSFSVYGELGTADGKPLTLVTNPVSGDPAIISIDELALGFSYSSGAQGHINASFIFLGKLVLDISADMNTNNHSWDFSGNINIPGTCINLGISPNSKGGYAVPLGTLVTKLFPTIARYIPSSLNDLSISILLIDYSYAKGAASNSTYKFQGGLDGQWSLGGDDIKADVEVTLTNDLKEVSADFIMDGFDFNLKCDFGTSDTITASIEDEIDGQKLNVSGTLKDNKNADPPNKTASMSITSLPSLGTLMAWFVKKVTNDPYFILPDPWSTLLNEINFDSVLKDLSFEIEIVPPHDQVTTTQKIVSCVLTPPPGHNTIFGITIKNIKLGYDTLQKTKGKSGLTFVIDLKSKLPFLDISTVKWDPVTERPPAVPGKGTSILDIELLALGQHITFNPLYKPAKGKFIVPPKTVQEAVTDLQLAVNSLSGTSSPAMIFAKDGGWLVGAHAVFLGQADVQFIFDDPEMYGLRVEVNKGKNTTLNKLAGLIAEILYRKVSETVGEYEGFLTLPTKLRKMQFGNAFLTLPSISVSIYTNGDFSFNIGFPYNLDFSHSFSVIADSFTGAGGFYFAKLNGLHPKVLPKATNGNFNPITEIGVGFRVGRAIAFHKGPLSASASIVLEALFQGVFAKFSLSDGDGDAEYYNIHAALEIVGHIQGKINFAIIQASLNVTAFIRVDATLIAYEPTEVSVTASIDVSITVSIDLGLFSIHIHCHFSTTFHTQATLGSLNQGAPPWNVSSGANKVLIPNLLEVAPLAPPVTWQTLTASSSKALNVNVLPQPTSTGSGDWDYVCQFALNLKEADNNSYQNFVEGLLVWALYALTNPTTSSTYESVIGTNSGTSTKITLDQVKAFTTALNNKPINADNPYNYDSVKPSIGDVQALFYQATANTALFAATIIAPTAPASTYRAVFFPILPSTTVTVTSSKESTQSAPTTEPAAPAADIITYQQNIFIEFIILTISNAMSKAEELEAFDTKGNSTAYDV